MPPFSGHLSGAILAIVSVAYLPGCRTKDTAPAPAVSAAAPESRPSTAAPPAAPSPVAHWRALLATPRSIERDAELAVVLEELAGRDTPAAAEMLRALPDEDRKSVVRALFIDSAHRPERALQLAATFVRADPERSRDHGHSLVYILTTAGEYDAAIRFAVREIGAGESENPVEWLKATFTAWTAAQPEVAATQVLALPGSMREEGLQAVAAAWARTDPNAALTFIERMPVDAERRTGIEAALRTWTETDPAAAAAWIQRFEPRHEFDYSLARLVNHERYADRTPEALTLAARIVDPELRSHTTALLLRRLASKDVETAVALTNSVAGLLPADKQALLAHVNGTRSAAAAPKD